MPECETSAMQPGPTDDLGVALGLVLEILCWIESTPEPEVELSTAVKWGEGIVGALSEMSPTARRRLLDLCDEWTGESSYVTDDILQAVRESVDEP